MGDKNQWSSYTKIVNTSLMILWTLSKILLAFPAHATSDIAQKNCRSCWLRQSRNVRNWHLCQGKVRNQFCASLFGGKIASFECFSSVNKGKFVLVEVFRQKLITKRSQTRFHGKQLFFANFQKKFFISFNQIFKLLSWDFLKLSRYQFLPKVA